MHNKILLSNILLIVDSNINPSFSNSNQTISYWFKLPSQFNYSTLTLINNGDQYSNGFSMFIDQNDGAYGSNNYIVGYMISNGQAITFNTNQNELENWNTNLSSYAYSNDLLIKVKRELIRLNTSAKFAFKLGDKIDFAGVNFVQFPINSNFLKPRWAFDSNLYFEMSKKLNFILHYDHNYDVYRVLPIDNYYYNVTLGIQVKL